MRFPKNITGEGKCWIFVFLTDMITEILTLCCLGRVSRNGCVRASAPHGRGINYWTGRRYWVIVFCSYDFRAFSPFIKTSSFIHFISTVCYLSYNRFVIISERVFFVKQLTTMMIMIRQIKRCNIPPFLIITFSAYIFNETYNLCLQLGGVVLCDVADGNV